MTRILVLNYEFPPLGGGAGNATLYLLKEFSKNSNIEIDLVTSSIGAYREEQFSENIKIYFLDIGKKGNAHFQTNKDLITYSLKAYFFCKRLMVKRKYDLCHAFFGIPCGYVAMKLGLPYIVSLRGSDVPFYNKRFFWLDTLLFKRMSRKIWKHAINVVANSQLLKDLAQKSSPRQLISIIPNGVDTERFSPLVHEFGNPIRLISVGRLISRKGYNYLLDAMKGISGIELTAVGDGNLKNDLVNQAKANNVIANFVGKKDQSEIIELLCRSDIFVMPSVNEGMSNAVLEAMACGLPIITTDTGGAKELVDDNGFIVEKANPDSLKVVIQKFIDDPEFILAMGKKSRARAEIMSWGLTCAQYTKLYELA